MNEHVADVLCESRLGTHNMTMNWITFVALLLGLWLPAAEGKQQDAAGEAPDGCDQPTRVHSRELLLDLQRRGQPEPGLLRDIPEELIRRCRKPRKRGRRGGVHHRLRRRHDKPPLPSVLFSNACSLRNKLDELRANTRFCNEYRESCVMIFTETWFQEDYPDQLAEVPGFTIVRMDRNSDSGKTKGGGICF